MKGLAKKILLYTFVLFFFSFAFGQESINTGDMQDMCIDTKYQIDGRFEIKSNQLIEYSLQNLEGEPYLKGASIIYKLYKDGKLIETFRGAKYFHNFTNLGTYILQADIVNNLGCSYLLEQEIVVFDQLLLYIGGQVDEFDLGFAQNFEKLGIFIKKIPFPQNKIISESETFNILYENVYYIKHAKNYIINSTNFDQIFHSLSKFSENKEIDFGNKDIFVINSTNKYFFKRVLSRYVNILGDINLYVIEDNNFFKFLSNLSFGREVTDEEYVQPFSLSFATMPKYYILSYLVDNMIFHGFPISLLSLVLILSVAALMISIFRQIIGFSVFGIYSPLIFALSMSVLGYRLAILLFVAAFLSTLLTRLITKKIYLLHSAKVVTLIILYFLIAVFLLGIDRALGINFINFNIFANSFIIFPIVFLILVADKVFYDGFQLFDKKWLLSFGEFLLVSLLVHFLIGREGMRHVLLSYPELIILIFALNIFVGRFTGLQLLEYFRFLPIIKKHLDDEEE